MQSFMWDPWMHSTIHTLFAKRIRVISLLYVHNVWLEFFLIKCLLYSYKMVHKHSENRYIYICIRYENHTRIAVWWRWLSALRTHTLYESVVLPSQQTKPVGVAYTEPARPGWACIKWEWIALTKVYMALSFKNLISWCEHPLYRTTHLTNTHTHLPSHLLHPATSCNRTHVLCVIWMHYHTWCADKKGKIANNEKYMKGAKRKINGYMRDACVHGGDYQ